MNADANLAEIEALHGFNFRRKHDGDITLGEFLDRVFHKRPVAGDRIQVGSSEFVVREVVDGKIKTVSMLLRKA